VPRNHPAGGDRPRTQRNVPIFPPELCAMVANMEPHPGGVSGKLDQPQQDAEVGSYPAISGQVTGVPPQSDLWIAVRRGPGGVFWPKEPKVQPDEQGRFKLAIIEEGPPGRLVISLLMVPRSRSREFDQWLKRGHETGRYPGIPPEGADAELHSVSVRYRVS
jgi:hypothetical protein